MLLQVSEAYVKSIDFLKNSLRIFFVIHYGLKKKKLKFRGGGTDEDVIHFLIKKRNSRCGFSISLTQSLVQVME
ncbi:MAG: hypothetical protein D6767_00040, partial [Candidatus Hydrogenedentota bacterium]